MERRGEGRALWNGAALGYRWRGAEGIPCKREENKLARLPKRTPEAGLPWTRETGAAAAVTAPWL
jgi:hypothetical protein